MPRAAGCCLALLIAAIGFRPAGAEVQDGSYVPSDGAVVLEHVTGGMRPKPLAKEDLSEALSYARTAIRQGDEEGDPHYFGYAQSALAAWWDLPQPPPDVRLLRATILQWLHQFDAARADLDALIAADGADLAQAHLTRATIDLVQGDAAAARRDCAALIGHAETLIAATCIASATSRLGHLADAASSLELAIAQTPNNSQTALRWALTEQADMQQRLGQPARADSAYRAALAASEREAQRDPYLLAAYADFLLDSHRAPEVIVLLQGLERIDNLLLRLALAEQELERGAPQWHAKTEQHKQELQRRFAETRDRGDGVHQREEAIFLLKLLDQPAKALRVAQENWQRQRELIDARLLIACALAAGQPEAARGVREWASSTHLEDARL